MHRLADISRYRHIVGPDDLEDDYVTRGGLSATFTYDDASRVTRIDYANDAYVTRQYDAAAPAGAGTSPHGGCLGFAEETPPHPAARSPSGSAHRRRQPFARSAGAPGNWTIRQTRVLPSDLSGYDERAVGSWQNDNHACHDRDDDFK